MKEPYYNVLVAFKQVSESVFGTKLRPSWREHLHHLKDVIHILVSSEGMPLTPKLHVLTVHVEQWIDRNGRAMGKEGESSGEALHHIWKRMEESQGEIKDKDSKAYKNSVLNLLLRFNVNNL